MSDAPEAPVCTCISVPVGGGFRYVRVFDPYCQIGPHKAKATYAGPEPTYPKAAGNG